MVVRWVRRSSWITGLMAVSLSGALFPTTAASAAERELSASGELNLEELESLDDADAQPSMLPEERLPEERLLEEVPLEGRPPEGRTPEGKPPEGRQPEGRSLEDVPSERFAEEVPEEILRTEIITGARSPLTGEPLTAVEYAQLQAELASPAGGNLVSPDIEYLIFLLQLRRAVRPIIPFIP